MQKIISIIGFCFFLTKTGLAQEVGKERICLTYDISGTISKNDIDRFHEFVLKVYDKRVDYNSNDDTISFLDIYRVRLEDSIPFDCNIIENGDFLNYLAPEHVSQEWFIWEKYGIRIKVKNMLCLRSILFNSKKPLMEFWMWEMPLLDGDDVCVKLLQTIKEYNMISLYELLEDSSVQCLIGVNKDKDVFIIRVENFNKTISVFPAKEFVDSKFPFLFPDEKHFYGKSKWHCLQDSSTQIKLDKKHGVEIRSDGLWKQ